MIDCVNSRQSKKIEAFYTWLQNQIRKEQLKLKPSTSDRIYEATEDKILVMSQISEAIEQHQIPPKQ